MVSVCCGRGGRKIRSIVFCFKQKTAYEMRISGLEFRRVLFRSVAIAVKLDSPGPVFFRQPREGYNNRTFHVLKFRSMRADAQQVEAIVQASRSDPRITRVGAFTRRTSIDELPQFFNVDRKSTRLNSSH